MKKEFIKKLFRESIFNIEEAEKEEPKDKKGSKEVSPKQKKQLDSQAVEIRNNVGPGKPLKYVQVLRASGLIPDDATKEEEATLLSLYRKKILNKREMVDGVETTRSLTPEEADVLYTVIKNPGAFK